MFKITKKYCKAVLYPDLGTNKIVCFRVMYQEEESAVGERKRELRRQIEAAELEVLTVISQKREELRLESERLEKLLHSLQNE